MKITMKSFFMAALALMTVACSSNDENDFAQQPKTGEGITITAQLAPKSGNAATRALVDKSSYIEAKWAVDEHLAILYEVSGTKYAADARITEVDGSTGAATIEFTVEAGTEDETPCTLVYPYSAANDEHDGLKALDALLGAQDGKLISRPNLDIRVGAGTILTTTPGLSVEIQPEAQNAIFQFTIKDASNLENINVTKLTITTGAQDFVITPEGAKSTFFAALPALTEQAVGFVATGSDGHTYYAGNPEVTFTAGKYYQSTIKMIRHNTIDLSTVTKSVTAMDGDVLTGKLANNVYVNIADGATVRLNGVSINADGAWKTGHHGGLDCNGDATIILMDGTTNTVKGFYENYPGIYVPQNYSLTIKGETAGTGSLNASSNGAGAGIGCGYGGGSDPIINCGNINIEGGIITATGGMQSAGIGGGKNGSCGNITISGGTIMATGGSYAVAIGGGESASCGDITITTDGILIASKGSGATNCIGAGNDGSCGTLSVYGATGAITASPYTHNYNLGFRVNGGGTQVHFAPGNLQATTTDGTTWTWHFAPHQWDYIGNAPGNTLFPIKSKMKLTGPGTVDLFCWSGDLPGVEGTYGLHSIYIGDSHQRAAPFVFQDWGNLSIGGDAPGTWRTLSKDEWTYLFQSRPGAYQKYASATVHGVHGFVLLPDKWALPAGCSFIAGMGGWNRNVYTDAQWNLMETYGAVFLPAAGWRMVDFGSESVIRAVGSNGYYWSSTSKSWKDDRFPYKNLYDHAMHQLVFDGGALYLERFSISAAASAVRLVK